MPDTKEAKIPDTDPQVYDAREIEAKAKKAAEKEAADKENENSLIQEVRDRLRESNLHENEERVAALEDLKFKKGGDNQWPSTVLEERKRDKRPIITINRLPPFVDQIVGDGRQNKTTIKIRPSNSGKKAMDLAGKVEGRMRHIQDESDAQIAYETALQAIADAGRGMITVEIIDCPTNPFFRDIGISRVSNAYSHYLDPAWDGQCTESSLKHRKYHIVTKLIKRRDFEALYPDKTPMQVEKGTGDDDAHLRWATEGEVRICDYWVKRAHKKRLHLLDDNRVVEADEWDKIKDDLAAKQEAVRLEAGEIVAAEMPGEDSEPLDEGTVVLNMVPEIIKTKTIKTYKILWYKVDGAQILDGPVEWPGRFIPHLPVWGKEINIEGKRDIRGVIRNAIGPQKIINYERTAEIERNVLAKTPPVELTPAQIKGHTETWSATSNLKYALYNPDPLAGKIGPIHPSPPQPSAANIYSYKAAGEELHDVIGLPPPSLGKQSSAGSSGKKEMTLQREGDVGSYEFHDNLVRTIRHCGRVILDLFPYVYDTERELATINEDGSEEFVTFNQEIIDKDTGETVLINDLSQFSGTVVATAGPSYTTQRLETFANLTELAQTVPIVAEVGPDMIVKNLDFVGSDELTKRIRRILIANGSVEPNEEEAKEIAKKQAEAEENQPDQPDDPEAIKAQLEIQEKDFDVKKAEIELKKEVIKLQQLIAEMDGNVEEKMQGAAEAAIKGFVELMGGAGESAES